MDRLTGLALWLADNAGQELAPFHEGFCRELIGRAIPLSRSSLGLELLHPEQSGQQSVWSNEMHATIRPAYHGVELTSDYLLSPARIVDETNRPFRRCLDAPAADMPLLEELRLNGATDYAIFPLPFQDRTRSAFLSFATAEPAGFSDADLEALAAACRLFSPYAERRALRRIAVDLLDTYVGRHAGERVFQGSILRGEVETISCAILMCDMRGFTVLSNRMDRSAMIDILNRSFEAIEAPVEARVARS
jgi:adenylate cyclase